MIFVLLQVCQYHLAFQFIFWSLPLGSFSTWQPLASLVHACSVLHSLQVGIDFGQIHLNLHSRLYHSSFCDYKEHVLTYSMLVHLHVCQDLLNVLLEVNPLLQCYLRKKQSCVRLLLYSAVLEVFFFLLLPVFSPSSHLTVHAFEVLVMLIFTFQSYHHVWMGSS